jgi:hypothetical protein
MESFAQCRLCGEAIGVYERLAVVNGDVVRTSSLAREPALVTGSEALFHEACAHQAYALIGVHDS